MRSKEEAHDYRYFPDPDLPPMVLDQAFLDEVQATLPELPTEKKQRFESELKLSSEDAGILTADRENSKLVNHRSALNNLHYCSTELLTIRYRVKQPNKYFLPFGTKKAKLTPSLKQKA